MKTLKHFLIRIEDEYQEKVGSLYVPKTHNTRSKKGIVEAVPLQFDGPEGLPYGFADDFIGKHDMTQPLQSTKREGRAFMWFEAAIQDRIVEGDQVWFFQNMNNRQNHLGDNLLSIRPAMIYAFGAEKTPYRGLVTIKPALKYTGPIIVPDMVDNRERGRGTVVAFGAGIAGDPIEIKAGDEVIFRQAPHFEEDGLLYVANCDLYGTLETV
jgi:co-chaperonin GroES (HSP10)